LLLSDVVMPGMGGFALAEHFLTIHPETRVLYISGYPDDAVSPRQAVGAEFAFLQKPFRTEQLLGKVRDLLDLAGDPS
jgi:DNA-binding NtrC family response regulator